MSDQLTIPTGDLERLTRPEFAHRPHSTTRHSDIIRNLDNAIGDRIPQVTSPGADTLGRTPTPDPYTPNRWQKVRDFCFPCCRPPAINPIDTARPARPGRILGNYSMHGAAPEPAPLPGRMPTMLEEFTTPRRVLPATPEAK